MPVTPFHFGIGLLLKGTAPARVSFLAFAASQVVIDLETAYFIFTNQWPLHRWLHTFALATPVGVAVGVLIWFSGRFVSGVGAAWRAEINLRAASLGGAAGGLTHPLLDGVMHGDIHPFDPFTAYNPLHLTIGVLPLHIICAIAGLTGAILWVVRSGRKAP